MEALRRRWGLEGTKVLLTLARLTPRKGQAEMIRAMPAILARHPRARYLIAGTGKDEDRLRGLVRGLALEGKVILTGEVPEEDKLPILDLCDLYLLPSRREGQRVKGLGIALLEAGARGKPLVAGRYGGIPEVIQERRTGLLVDASRPRALARADCAILEDEEVAAPPGRAARERIREGFLAGGMARASLAAIQEILGEAAASTPPCSDLTLLRLIGDLNRWPSASTKSSRRRTAGVGSDSSMSTTGAILPSSPS